MKLLLFTVGALFLVVGYLSLPTTISEPERTEVDENRALLKAYSKAIELLKKDLGVYPNSSSGLQLIYENTSNEPGWNGPYLKKVRNPVDTWGNKFVYRFPSECQESSLPYDFYSVGENGIDECGEGKDIFIERQ